MLLIMPGKVNADSASVSFNCNATKVKAGNTINCTVQGTADTEIATFEAKVALGDGLSYVDFTVDRTWQGDGEDGFISLYKDSDLTGTFPLGTLTVKVNDNATDGTTTINLTDIEFSKGTKIVAGTSNPVTITISNAVDSPKGLKSLSALGGGVIGPQFSSSELSYMLTLPGSATSFGFNAVPHDANDEIVYLNADDSSKTHLDPANIAFATTGGKDGMLIYIEVGTGDRKVTYSVGVNKNVSTNDKSNELSSLKVGDQVVSLVSGKYEYSVTLNDVSSYSVVVDLNDRTNYDARFVTPRTGEGSFTIEVLPKDSSSGLRSVTYTINVTKSGGGSSTPTPTPTPTNPTANPQTGGAVSIIMALVLIASFATSIYFYKRNISYFSK